MTTTNQQNLTPAQKAWVTRRAKMGLAPKTTTETPEPEALPADAPSYATAHSHKGLETLHRMGTEAKDWGLAEIKWEDRKVDAEVWVPCPKCGMNGQVWKFGEKLVGPHELQKFLGREYHYGR